MAAPFTLVLAGCGSDVAETPSVVEVPGPDDEPSTTATTPATSDTPAAEAGPLVVFLGDSLTAGFGLAGDLAFPAVLDRMMDAAGRPVRVVNAGVSGDTTAGGQRRLDWLLRQSPDVLVIGLGANDGLRGLDLADTEANLRAIVIGARTGGAVPLILGMRIPTNYGPDYTEPFAAIYGRLAEELDVPIVPLALEGVGGVDAMNLEDGIHPNEQGHERMAENIQPVLEAALDRVLPRGSSSSSSSSSSTPGSGPASG